MKRKKLIFEAVPFCFGPVTTSIEVAKELSKNDFIEIFWLASGTTLDLLLKEDCKWNILKCDTTNRLEINEHKQFLLTADLVISNTNPDFAEACLQFGCKVGYIDVLYWMWDSVPSFFNNLNPFIIERFYGLEEQYRRLGKPTHGSEVGPLINESIKKTQSIKSNLLLISFGGVINPFHNYTRHINVIIDIILSIPEVSSFEEIIFCGGGMDNYKQYSKNRLFNNITFETLPHSKYLQKLQEAKKVIMSPGLTGFYEAYFKQIPVFFLIPHNYSQYLQLVKFKENGLAPFSMNFDDCGIKCDLQEYEKEIESVNKIIELLDQFCDSNTAQQILKSKIRSYILGGELIQSKQSLYTLLGNSGASNASNLIIERLNNEK